MSNDAKYQQIFHFSEDCVKLYKTPFYFVFVKATSLVWRFTSWHICFRLLTFTIDPHKKYYIFLFVFIIAEWMTKLT